MKKNLHICFLTNEYPPGNHGGIGSFTQTLARGLARNGHQVTVLGSYPSQRTSIEKDMGVQVIRVPRLEVPKLGFIINAMRIRKALSGIQKKSNIDILEAPNLGLGLLSGSSPGVKILRIHTTISTDKGSKFLRSWRIRKAFSIAHHVCAVSNFSAESNSKRLQLGNRQIEVIPNPVDISIFHPKAADVEKEGLILFVGTVCENKGIRQLIQAMPKVVGAVPSSVLWVVGRDWPHPDSGKSFTKVLKDLIPPELNEHIVFMGPVEHSKIPDMISKAQVCVYPSHMENMPVSWLEGMAMAKAVVASNTGPGPEVVEDGVSGLLCNPYDPSDIAEKIVNLLGHTDLRSSLAEQARKRVTERFSLDVLLEKNLEFYERCIKKKTP